MAFKKSEDPFYQLFRDFAEEIVETCDDYVKLVDGYPETITMIPGMNEGALHLLHHAL